MASKITSTHDGRISGDVEERNRVHKQMEAIWSLPDDQLDGTKLDEAKKLEQAFDDLTDRIELRKRQASRETDAETSASLHEAQEAVSQEMDKKRAIREVPKGADWQLQQTHYGNGADPQTGEPVGKIKLRGAVMQSWNQLLDEGMSTLEMRQMFRGQTGSFAQNVISRFGSGGSVNLTDDIEPQLVETRFVEILRNINGVEKCGAEVWYTPDLIPRKLPKAVPFGTNPRTAVTAPRAQPTTNISETAPSFIEVNTSPREFSAIVPMERSTEMATPANISGKIAELIARELGEQTNASWAYGATDHVEEGLSPSGTLAITSGAISTANQTITGAAAIAENATNVPTFDNIMSVMAAKPDFPATLAPMGDVWHTSKRYAFTIMSIRDNEMRPIFSAMGERGARPIDTIYGRPVVYSDYMIGVPTAAGRIVAMFGDFWAGYVLRKAGDIEIATDESVRFESNQIVYRAIMYCAGAIKNLDQFVYLISS